MGVGCRSSAVTVESAKAEYRASEMLSASTTNPAIMYQVRFFMMMDLKKHIVEDRKGLWHISYQRVNPAVRP